MVETKSVTKIIFILFAVLLCVAVAFSVALCQSPCYASAAENHEQDVYKRIDNYLADAFQKAHFPAMSVTIVDKDSVLLSKTYGQCKSADTPFLLGSVSKSFTALCVMQLVEQGKIQLEASVSTYLEKNAVNNAITVRQLLNHTSGLGEHQNLTNYKIVGEQGVHVYANVNYSLLGEIVEVASGMSYEDYVTENIFQPLDMTHSAATLEKAQSNGLIATYENWFGKNTETAPKYPRDYSAWITTSAGYLSSSTADLGKYLQMYLNGGNGVITQESVNKMFYDNVDVTATIPYKYGMGWTLINEPLKEPALRHSGLVETGMSTVYILPESGLGVAIAVNTNDYFVGKDLLDRMDWSVALLLMGDTPNEIRASEYVTRHFLYDLAYFTVFAISALPLCLITVYKKRLPKGKLWVKITLLVLLHLILPAFILLLPQMFFATPLWVVRAFVPDMFLTIVVSSCLLFVGGAVKSVLFVLSRKRTKSFCQE